MMKDWEIAETYVLPRILCLRTGNNTLLAKPSKPNLRFFSLSEKSSEWATWKSSDYFYPEMIPEPDYSDSEDSIESEDDDEDDGPYSRDPRSAFERLRELTEVYVSNVDSKKQPAKTKQSANKKGEPTSKNEQTKVTTKDEAGKPIKPTSKTPQTKKSPPTSPKAPGKVGSKSSSKISKTSAKGSPSTVTVEDKSSKTEPKSPPKTKSPPLVSKSTKPTTSKASPSAVKKTKTDSSEAKVDGQPSILKTKPVSKPKSPPPTPTKTKIAKPTTKGKTPPKTNPKSKAASKGPAMAKMATPSGDATAQERETSGVPAKKHPSSPSSDKSRSPVSSAASEEQSSEDEQQLIKPKKPVNPYLQSTERQKLHKELKFSQKYGKLGASSKTELQLALERYTENKMKRELNAEEKSSLEKILEFQAKKIEMQETMDKCPAWIDRLQKPPSPMADPKTDEFYRVHARVVSNNILTHCFLSDDDRSDCSSPRKLQYSDSGSDS